MLNIAAIKRDVAEAKCQNVKLSCVFRNLKSNEIDEFIKKGFHPSKLSRKNYSSVVQNTPLKLYLFKPQHVNPLDLLMVLQYQTNPTIYANHIQYHQSYILQHGSFELVSRCVPHMILTDNDVRYISEKYPEQSDILLATVSYKSIRRLSYLFTEEIARDMILNDDIIADALYEHQLFSEEFLWDMHFSYGIVPANKGIDSVSPKDLKTILAGVTTPKSAINLISVLPKSILMSTPIKTYILSCIVDGEKLEHYISYAKEFLKDHVQDVGIYVNIIFPENGIDLNSYPNELSRIQLSNVCKFIDCYTVSIDFIINVLIEKEYYDLLGLIIEKIDTSVMDETLCVNIVKHSINPIKVRHIPVHSLAVATECAKKKYVDLVDFLDCLDLTTLLSVAEQTLFTTYAFETNWLNDNFELLALYVHQYGFCAYRMKKLLFEYPLQSDTVNLLLNLMFIGSKESLFSDKVINSLEYFMCSTELGNFKPLTLKTVNVTISLYDNQANHETYPSVYSNDLKNALQTIIIPNLQSLLFRDVSTVKMAKGICLQYYLDVNWLTDEERLCKQISDIATFATYGLFYIPDCAPNWVPASQLAKCEPMEQPTVLKGDIDALVLNKLTKFINLGMETTKQYKLLEPMSNDQAALNSLLVTIVSYLVIGSVRYVGVNNIQRFVTKIISQYCEVLKSDESVYESVTEVVQELTELKKSIRHISDVIDIKLKKIVNTVELGATLVRVFYNNHNNKFT
ncbi:iev morphogenesis [Pteropox virus]|uniref:Iev morphogenesis n=1 Tax=Pteropox virus TaxID=1873698 RepID=A0A1B1MRA7_9POXV|nr:iev morphogenesis [Pteropox virus]ANS71114.1 iev morphogenesis [Pteropox virus]